MVVSTSAHAGDYRVAVFHDAVSGADEPTVAAYERSLQAAGLTPQRINLKRLASAKKLVPETYDAVLLLDSPRTPARALRAIQRYMKAGGDLVLLGGEAFARPMTDDELAGRSPDDVTGALSAGKTLAGVDWAAPAEAGSLVVGSSDPARPHTAVPTPGPDGAPGVAFTVSGFGDGWATWLTHVKPPPAETNVLRLWVRGDERTPQLAVELQEQLGVRWVAVIDAAPGWQRVAILLSHFELFRNGESPERGGKDDAPRPGSLTAVSVGIADEFFVSAPGDHRFALSGVEFAHVAYSPEKRYPNPFQHAGFVFYPFDYLAEYRLPDQARLTALAADVPPAAFAGEPLAFSGGRSAIGVGLPDRTRLVPLLQVHDEHGRTRGWGLSVLRHDGGPYAGGRWVFSGIDAPEVVSDPRFIAAVTSAIKKLSESEDAFAAVEAPTPPAVDTPPSALRGRLRINGGGRLVDASGEPAFLIGCNYAGPFGRSHMYAGKKFWNAELLENDFRVAAQLGINAIRLWVTHDLCRDPGRVQAILDAAEAHGIYLLIHFRGDGVVETRPADVVKVAAKHRKVVNAFAGHPRVLGFDIQNEPYLTTIGAMTLDGEPSEIVRLRPAEKYAAYLDTQALEERVRNRPPWPSMGRWIDDDTARQLLAADMLWASLPNPMHPDRSPIGMPPEAEAEFRAAVNATFARWMEPLRAMILGADPEALITVGYITDLATLPCNAVLDFVSHHTYKRPKQVADTQTNIDAMDDLGRVWPGVPVSLGEFGYSAADVVGGRPLGSHPAAVGEAAIYLAAYAGGHFGAFKWQLHDEPIPYLFDLMTWGQGSAGHMQYESALGILRYDGTDGGTPRPVGWMLRELGRYLADRPVPGTLELEPADYPGGVGYTYRADDALFIGGDRYQDDAVTLESTQPTNLMLSWDGVALRLMSTADADVTVDVRALTGRPAREGAPTPTRLHLLEGHAVVIELQTP